MTVPISLMAVLTAFASLLAQPLSENPKDDSDPEALDAHSESDDAAEADAEPVAETDSAPTEE